MNKLSKLLLFVLFVCTPLLPQSLLMKPGNAVQYFVEGAEIIHLCTDSVKQINGTNYYLFKILGTKDPNHVSYDYEGISGDSIYYGLTE